MRSRWGFLILTGCLACGSPPADEAPPSVPEPVVESAPDPQPPTLVESKTGCLERLELESCEHYRRWERDRDAFAEFATTLAQRHPDRWIVSYFLAHAAYDAGDVVEADKGFQRAIEEAAAAGEATGEAYGGIWRSEVALQAGRLDAAEALFRATVEVAAVAGTDRVEISALYRLAGIYENTVRYLEARDAYRRVVELYDGQPERIRNSLLALAGVQRHLGRLDDASRTYDRLIEATEDDADAQARALIGRCVVALDRQRFSAAATDCDRASRVAAALDDVNLELQASGIASYAHALAGEKESARKILAAQDDKLPAADDWHATIYLQVSGYAYRAMGDLERAAARYRSALERTSATTDAELSWLSHAGLAGVSYRLGDVEAAKVHARSAVDQVESLRASIDVLEDRTRFLQTRAEAYRVLAAAAAAGGPGGLDEAFRAIDDAHARTLVETLDAAGDLPQASTLRDVQDRLATNEVLIEYLLGEDESLLLAVSSERAELLSLAPRKRIETLVERYRAALLRPLTAIDARLAPEADFERHRSVGRELYEALLEPAQAFLAGAERIVIVPDRKLHLLPFEALPTTTPGFVGTEYIVSYVPAASLLAKSSPFGASSTVLVVANSASSEEFDLAGLANAASEARAVGAFYDGHATVLLDEDATLDNLRQRARRPFDVFHVVAHTIVQSGEGPRVLLQSAAGSGRFLDTHSVRSLEHVPRLAVLSSCDTAQGELVGGEGILGLVRAFTEAGTPTVAATLWRVDDATSTELMAHFHRALAAGASPAAALHRARAALLKDRFVHPFYWAPFVVYGGG